VERQSHFAALVARFQRSAAAPLDAADIERLFGPLG
jgi:hypothetical protein